jgi:penicillin-binding protein 2B
MDAKTGEILGTTSYPSFNPNTKNITNFMNPLVSYAFEPGSTMKIFTYMSVLEKGTYNGKESFQSGNFSFENTKDKVNDWNVKGWGKIDFDLGFTLSSNVGVSYLTRDYINGGELRSYFSKLGFSKKTGISLPNEYSGEIDFKYPIEIANAGFGQGITTTPIQMLQAVSSISNDGTMIKPYIVKEIIDSNEKTIYQGKREEVGKVASTETINKMKDLMYNVINDLPERATGTSYKIEGYNIIGKTGTAQYINPNTGKYETGEGNYIRSFIGMFPKDDPEIIIYFAMKDPVTLGAGMSETTKKLITDISNYKGIYKKLIQDQSISNYIMPNLLNKSISSVEYLKDKYKKVYIIGAGAKVVNQYPNYDIKVNSLNTIFIITNYKELSLPDLSGLSLKDIMMLSNMLKLELEFDGMGYVYSQELIGNKLIVKLQQ